MQPTRTLPDGYVHRGTLDLSRSRAAVIALNVAGLVLLVFFGWAFLAAAQALRPGEIGLFDFSISAGSLADLLLVVVGVIGLLAAVIVLHEAVHGLCFWWFTHQRPVFGFRGAYAYAAAPEWYLPRGQYIVVGLAPLVVLSLIGLALIPLVPGAWLSALLVFLVMNASGAVGDLLVVAWLLTRPARTLARDVGDSVSIYE